MNRPSKSRQTTSVTDQFISVALSRMRAEGLNSLVGSARVVAVISEVEAECDINGVDVVVDQIESGELVGVSDAFRAIGANEIAVGFRKIEEALPNRDEDILDRVNRLLTARSGCDYEAIKEYVRKAERGTRARADL